MYSLKSVTQQLLTFLSTILFNDIFTNMVLNVNIKILPINMEGFSEK